MKKVKKITPVEAITIGLTSAETKLKPSVIKNAKTSFEMAINEIFKYKKSTAMITLVLTVSMYLSMLFVMIWYSSYKMTDNSNLWFCLPMNDTYIAGDISDELMQYLNNECEFLKSVVAGDFSYKEEATVDDYPEMQGTIRYDSYTDFTKSITGINILEGRAPEGNDEIVAGLGLLSKTKLKIGDTIRLTINDVTREYTITGSYDTVADNSVKFMLTTEALKESVKDYAYTRAYIRLNKDSDFNAFKQDVESKFTGVIVDKKWFALENSVESIRQMLEAISAVLVFIFIMFSMLNIIIVSLMENKKKYRSFGIMKSLGFTTRYIVNQNLWKYFIISILGSIISLGLQLLVSRKLVAMMLVDAFVNPIMLLVLLLVGFIVLILGSTLLINRSIKKISPVELMEE